MTSASRLSDELDPSGVLASVSAAASQIMTVLSAMQAELVRRDPALGPYLQAMVDDFVDHATLTIEEMSQ